ncbi:MAG: RDD family protein [Chloroflexota bacterium]
MQECPRCRTLASDKAERCPACGFYFHREDSVAGVQEALPAAVALKLVNYAGFWRRVGAFAVDTFVLSSTAGGLGLISQRIYSSVAGTRSLPPELVLLVGFIEILFMWLYYAVMESSRWQATLGKQASGIIVTDYQGNRISFARASGRYVGKLLTLLSLLILGIGFLMIAFTEKKQALYDKLVGTLVVMKKVAPSSVQGAPQEVDVVPLGGAMLTSTEGRKDGTFCPKCGTQNEEGARFCKNCGASLQVSAATAPVAAVTMAYASFWQRLVAALLDGLIVGAASSIVLPGGPEASGSLGIVIGWLYYALLESSKSQATVGKMVLGIIVTDMNGNRISFSKATGRFFGKILSALTLGIGFLMIAFTEKKQGLHDKLAGTLVLKKK